MSPKPPALVADELQAQMDAYKAGITPRRSKITAPDEVRVAVEMARAADRHKNTPKSSRPLASSSHLPNGVPRPQFTSVIPENVSGSTVKLSYPVAMEGSSRPPPASASKTGYNGYSMGNSLPAGVSWRYVDILNPDGNSK